MIVEMINPKTVNISVIVIPCSLKASLTFSRRVRSPSTIFSMVCRIRENWDGSSLLFWVVISNLEARSSFKSAMRSRISLSPNLASFLCSLSRCSSIYVNFETMFFSSPVILVRALSISRNYRMSKSVFVVLVTFLTTSSSCWGVRSCISGSVGVMSSMEMPRLLIWVLVIIFSIEFLSLNPPVRLDVKLNHLPPFLKDSIVFPFSCSILYLSRLSSIIFSSISQPMCLKN